MLVIKAENCSVIKDSFSGVSVDLSFSIYPEDLSNIELVKVQELYTLGKYKELFVYLGRSIR